jgi:hypothetical protein
MFEGLKAALVQYGLYGFIPLPAVAPPNSESF